MNQEGIAHFNAGRFEDALRCFRAAAAAGESVPEARVFIGRHRFETPVTLKRQGGAFN